MEILKENNRKFYNFYHINNYLKKRGYTIDEKTKMKILEHLIKAEIRSELPLSEDYVLSFFNNRKFIVEDGGFIKYLE
jgi:hypothetical protein